MRLLIPLDGSRLAEQALAHALVFAKSFESELHLLQVIEKKIDDTNVPFSAFDWQLRCAQSKIYLQELKRTLPEQTVDVKYHVIEGDPPAEIVEFARNHQIDLTFLSAYGLGGVTQFSQGSTTQKVISTAGTSLMLIRPEIGPTPAIEDARYRRILVPIDNSHRSEWALSLAAVIAVANQAELDLVQIIQEPKVAPRVLARNEGKRLVDQLNDLNRLDAIRHVEEIKATLPSDLVVKSRVLFAPEVAPIVEEIAEATDVDLIVLSAYGMTDCSTGVCGPVAETILAHCTRPVLIFQDAIRKHINFKPIAGAPARSGRVETQHRASTG